MERITVVQLKEYLRSKDLTTSGNKRELYNKFLESVESESLEAEKVIDGIIQKEKSY